MAHAFPIGCMRVRMTLSWRSEGDAREALQRNLEGVALIAARNLQELVAGENKLAGKRHHSFKKRDADPHRLVCDDGFEERPGKRARILLEFAIDRLLPAAALLRCDGSLEFQDQVGIAALGLALSGLEGRQGFP